MRARPKSADAPSVAVLRCPEAGFHARPRPSPALFVPGLETMVKTDASDSVIAGILSQQHASGLWHPFAFFSKKITPSGSNYEIYDKELLAIIRAFEEWRPELAGSDNDTPTRVFTDHKKNLNVARPSRKLNLRFAGIDNSFPVSLLQPAATDPFPNQTTTTLPVVDANTRY